MEVVLLRQAREDREYWKSTNNEKIMKRISKLLEDILNMFSLCGFTIKP